MSEKLPYEDAFKRQMNNMLTPDSEASWEKMKHLLDRQETPKPFSVVRTLILWTIIAVLLLTIGWYFIHTQTNKNKPSLSIAAKKSSSENSINKKPTIGDDQRLRKQAVESSDNTSKLNNNNEIDNTPGRNYNNGIEKTLSRNSNNSSAPLSKCNPQNSSGNTKEKRSLGSKDKIIANTELKTISPANWDYEKFSKLESVLKNRKTSITKPIVLSNEKDRNDVGQNNNTRISSLTSSNKTLADVKVSSNGKKAYDSSTTVKTNDKISSAKTQVNNEIAKIKDVKDTSAMQKIDSLKPQSILAKNVLKANINIKYSISAGVGVQQQIPVNGQKLISVGYNGKSTLADYIPSAYLRFERNKKWFLQTEFIYAAPQLVNRFSYFRQTLFDSSSQETISYNLKKTFYTDIPVTFNYYVTPNLSIGIGAMYGWLHGAVAEKETNTKNLQTQQSVVVSETQAIKGFTDSFLYKTHTYLLLQSDYQWKRLSFGLRYSKDIEPYIKYTLPNGVVEDRKNWSLEFILRLQLVRSIK